MHITVTHYTKGDDAPRYAPSQEDLTVVAALADMFRRLKAGAQMTTSGFNYGLAIYFGPEEKPTGYDTAIYGGLSPQLQNFIIRATKWWDQEGMELGTPEHDRFIRSQLLSDTGHSLSAEEEDVALGMAEDQFLAAIAMAVETGETMEELFRPAPATTDAPHYAGATGLEVRN